jgi:hypothetical protein
MAESLPANSRLHDSSMRFAWSAGVDELPPIATIATSATSASAPATIHPDALDPLLSMA